MKKDTFIYINHKEYLLQKCSNDWRKIMKLSISTGMYYRKDHNEILEIIKKSGFENIELFMNQSFVDLEENIIVDSILNHSLNAVSIHTPLEFIVFERKQNEEYWINKSCKLAIRLNSELINTHMVLGKNFESTDLTLDEIHKKNLLSRSLGSGIILTTENMPAYCKDTFLGRYEEFSDFCLKENIPITFDITHYATGTGSIIEAFDKVKHLVKNIHLSNYSDGNEHKLLEEGDINIIEFLKYLTQIQYKGLLTLEFDFENKLRNKIADDEDAVFRLQKSREFVLNIIK